MKAAAAAFAGRRRRVQSPASAVGDQNDDPTPSDLLPRLHRLGLAKWLPPMMVRTNASYSFSVILHETRFCDVLVKVYANKVLTFGIRRLTSLCLIPKHRLCLG